MPGTGKAYDPLAAAGVQLLDSDPTGIAPPDGARLTLAFTVPGGATLVCQAEYAWEGTIQAAADYYNRRLSADGWNVPARRGDEGRRRLTASDGDVRAIVNLREDADDARIVDIQVVLITPSDEEEQ
jgi:hypothetical protein